MYEGVIAAESVLITVSARDGVEVGTEKAYQLADRLGRAKMFFVTQMDMDNADFYKVLEQLKSAFGPSVCPLVVPFMADGKVQCYINLVDNKAYKYDGGAISETEMPDTGHRLEGLIAAMSEAIAETDEALFEKFFSGEQFTRDEILHGIHQGVKSGSIAPVFCGSAVTMDGIDMLLDAMVDHLPSAYESAGLVAEDENGEPVEVPCTDEAPTAVLVFKTVADPFVGKLSYVKVVSGKITADSPLYNMRTSAVERQGKLLHTRGKKQEETTIISAGDIGAITKLPEAVTGDTLCDPEHKLTFPALDFPKPTLSMAVVAKNKADEGKVAQSLLRLMEEDPTIRLEQNKETKQQVLTGLGDQQLEVIVSKLQNKFGVEIQLEKAKVPYRETIQKKALPDKRQDFTADMGRAGGLVGHDALGRGHDGNAQAAENAGQLVSTGIDTQAGLGDAAQAGDNLLLAGVVLQGNADNALGAVVDELEVLDIALVQQDLRDGLLHVGRRHVHGVMLGVVRVADAGEHIRNGIRNVHDVYLLLKLPALPVAAARYRS